MAVLGAIHRDDRLPPVIGANSSALQQQQLLLITSIDETQTSGDSVNQRERDTMLASVGFPAVWLALQANGGR